MINQQFEELRDYLRDEKGLEAQLEKLPTGAYLVTVKNYPIKSGWNQLSVDILFVAPPGYPAAKPDCFWVSPQLRLANGAMPQNANDGTAIPGAPAQNANRTWFSWHLQTWDPNKDKLVTFLNAVVKRLVPAR